MDNIIKRAVEEKLGEMLTENGECSKRLKEEDTEGGESRRKPSRTENRLGCLLGKIRNGSSSVSRNKKKMSKGKAKHIYLKWMRYDPLKEKYVVVKANEGGGVRFAEWMDHQPLSFGQLQEKAKCLFFDNNDKNFFYEHKDECTFSFLDASNRPMIDSDDLWEYLDKKGIFVSKTKFVLQSIENGYMAPTSSCDTCGGVCTGAECRVCNQREDNQISDVPLPNFYMDDFDLTYGHGSSSTLNGISVNPSGSSTITSALDGISVNPSGSSTITSALDGISVNPSGSSTITSALDGIVVYTSGPSASSTMTDMLVNTSGTSTNPALNGTVANTSGPSTPSTFTDMLVDASVGPSAMPASETIPKYVQIVVKRSMVREDLVRSFIENKVDIKDVIEYAFMDPRGEIEKGRGLGVTRDVYSAFWTEVADSYLVGEKERVPYVRHDLYKNEWDAIGVIYVKGYLDAGYVPSTLSRSFISYCMFGDVDDADLLKSFKNFVSTDEREIIESALTGDKKDVYSSDEIFDFLEQFKCRTALSLANAKEVLTEIAKQELIQKPFLMASCWSKSFTILKNKEDFLSKDHIEAMYERFSPTSKKIIALLQTTTNDDAERDAFSFLKRFIKGLDLPQLKKFLRFTTGSDMIVVESIKIMYVKEVTSFARRPIAHTCGPVLELPAVYNNFGELREDFINVLSQNTWQMDLV